MARTLSSRELFYERFATEFDARMDRYEVGKRLHLIFEDLLAESDLVGMKLLDAGCGTGLFSAAAVDRGALVTSLDVGERLLEQVAAKTNSKRVVGDVANLPFEDASFDIVLSTEVIEHLAQPERGVRELCRVLKPRGQLIITTPNRVWLPAIRLATRLRLRPYEGLENWVKWRELRKWVNSSGLLITHHRGFNALPWLVPATRPLIDRLDHRGDGALGRLMINMAIVAERRSSAGGR
jgi:2-polyprenyl-3-methyl-5-hydroxy-6-metoxy-1,4-benzoquinol methylase